MGIVLIVLRIGGGLSLFLYGMRLMSDGVQQAAGERMQRALNFMTANRFVAVLTGFVVTALIQSSGATTVMLVSLVNAGLLTVTQSIGVIMGANIGTTTNAWIVSLVGFQLDITSLALPAIGIGFVVKVIKWRFRVWGDGLLGFGFIFIGLDFINRSLPEINPDSLVFIYRLSQYGMGSVVIAVLFSTVLTLVINSSAGSITMILTLAYRGVINYQMAAGMILGANIGTTVHAILAGMGSNTAAKQTALVHVLFNVLGSVVAIFFFRPLLWIVDNLVPGDPVGSGVATHLAMFHTVFNSFCTIAFLPFVTPLAKLVTWMIKPDPAEKIVGERRYRFSAPTTLYQNTPEMTLLRVEKEIRDMAALAYSMYTSFSKGLVDIPGSEEPEAVIGDLVLIMKADETYADEMREVLSQALVDINKLSVAPKTSQRISQLLRIVAYLEDMTDECCGLTYLLESSITKSQLIKRREMEVLIPYVKLVEDFLVIIKDRLGRSSLSEQLQQARELEALVNQERDRLRNISQERLEAGKSVRTELLFIDLIRRIERLGDSCYAISHAMARM